MTKLPSVLHMMTFQRIVNDNGSLLFFFDEIIKEFAKNNHIKYIRVSQYQS